jgi:hypothetical protein
MSDDAQARVPQDATARPWTPPNQPSSPAARDNTAPPETSEPGSQPEDSQGAAPAYGGPSPESGPDSVWAAPAAVYDRSPGSRPEQGTPAPKVPPGQAPAEPRRAEPDPWAPPAETGASGARGGAGAGSVHDQRTVASFPGVGTPPPGQGQGQVQPGPWGNPFAPPAAYPHYPRPAPGEPVPPPPIAPEGPGQVPYGYGYPGFPVYGQPGPGYQRPHGYGGWPPVMPPAPRNGLGTAGLVLGIVSAVVFCLWPLALVVGVLGVVFGVVGRRRAGRGEATNGGQALAGIICGAVGILLSAAMIVVFFFVPDDTGNGDSVTGDDGYSTSMVVPRLG